MRRSRRMRAGEHFYKDGYGTMVDGDDDVAYGRVLLLRRVSQPKCV